jgi:hypothetical protein
MIRGEHQTLAPEDQRIVATWGMKMAAVTDRTHRHRTIPPEYGRLLRERWEPPRGVYVWLAGYGVNTFVGTHKGFRFPLGEESGDAYSATLSVGHLVLQVLGLPQRPGNVTCSRRDMGSGLGTPERSVRWGRNSS